MKKCDYCAKEISYFEQYCDENCQANANKYYEKTSPADFSAGDVLQVLSIVGSERYDQKISPRPC